MEKPWLGASDSDWEKYEEQERQKEYARNNDGVNPIALLFIGAGYFYYGREFVINNWQYLRSCSYFASNYYQKASNLCMK